MTEEKKKDNSLLSFGIVFMITISTVLVFVGISAKTPQSEFYDRCIYALESILRSPSTLEITYKKYRNWGNSDVLPFHELHLDFDSENAFGATLRTEIGCYGNEDGDITKFIYDGEKYSRSDVAMLNRNAEIYSRR